MHTRAISETSLKEATKGPRTEKPFMIRICEFVLDNGLFGIAALNLLLFAWAFMFPYVPTSLVPLLFTVDPRSIPIWHRVISALTMGYNCCMCFSHGYILFINFVIGQLGLLAFISVNK